MSCKLCGGELRDAGNGWFKHHGMTGKIRYYPRWYAEELMSA